MMKEADITRAKILGVLIRDARLHANRASAECAARLQLEEAEFMAAETGDYVLSLPHLEVLALYLGVPIEHFWGTQTISKPDRTNYEQLLILRQKLIGAQIRQTREERGKSLTELSAESEIPVADLTAYEAGDTPISLFHLEQLGRCLNVSVSHFIDYDHGPLAAHEQAQKMNKRFEALPAEVKAFVTEPINIAYLETAMRLSEMDADRLRGIAEAILDITY
jgi:transcriptional regulator with XRE-family HTH domain